MSKSLISLGGGWASLTGSGSPYVTITYIVTHIDSCISDPTKTPPDLQEEGAVVANPKPHNPQMPNALNFFGTPIRVQH